MGSSRVFGVLFLIAGAAVISETNQSNEPSVEGQQLIELHTYPDSETIEEGLEVVFYCRDEGENRVPVKWTRSGGRPLPPGSTDVRGRLEIPNVRYEHSGDYICEAVDYPGTQIKVTLEVEHYSQINGRLLTPEEGCGYQPIPDVELATKRLELGNWPWMGAIIRFSTLAKKNDLISVCSAALITSRHALTSGYCANDAVRSIRLGQVSFQDVKVVKMEIHGDADWVVLKNFIAILFLETDVEFSYEIRPACLPLTEMSFSGLHRLIQGTFDVFKPITYASIKYEEAACEENFFNKTVVNHTLFCARSEDKIGLKGDPFIGIDNKSHIVHHIGMAAYEFVSNPSVFLYIHPYIQWINETIAGNIENTKNQVIYPDLQIDEAIEATEE